MTNREKIVGVIALESEKIVFFLYISQLIFNFLLSFSLIIKIFKSMSKHIDLKMLNPNLRLVFCFFQSLLRKFKMAAKNATTL